MTWKGTKTAQYASGKQWDAWRYIENDGITVVFISPTGTKTACVRDKRAASLWVRQQIGGKRRAAS